MAAWGAATAKTRSAGTIRDIIDNLFCTRFWDKGTCQSCNQESTGIFGPEEHSSFYCRACWVKHLGDTKETNEETWQEWLAWKPQMEESKRTVLSQTAQEHELKCALLTLSKVGGSISFLPGPSAFTRMKVHTFCKEEPALRGLKTKSYGKDSERFIKVFSQDEDPTIKEVRMHLDAEVLKEMDLTMLQDWQQQLTLGLERIKDEMNQRSTSGKQGNADGAAKPEVEESISKDGKPSKSMENDKQQNSSQAANKALGTPKSAPKAPPKAPGASPKAPAVPPQVAPASPQAAPAAPPKAPHKAPGALPTSVVATPPIDAGDFPILGGFPALGDGGGSKKKGGKKK